MKKLIVSVLALSILSTSTAFAAEVTTTQEVTPIKAVMSEDEETTDETTEDEMTEDETTEDKMAEDETTEEATETNAFTDENIKEVSVEAKTDALEIKGTKPELTNLKSEDFEKTLNAEINEYYDAEIEKAKEDGTKLLFFKYDTYTDGDIVSIVVSSSNTIASTKNTVKSFNFNNKTNVLVNLTKILGPNGAKLVNLEISKLTNYSDDYVVGENFNGATALENYYANEGAVTVIFADSQITKKGETNATFVINMSDVKDIVLTDEDYQMIDDVKYIPLRETCESLGYDLAWEGSTKVIDVTGYDGSKDNTLTIGKAEVLAAFNSQDNKTTKTLEGEAILNNGVTYVPLSYFEIILGATYDVNSDGIVTISAVMNK